MFFLQFLVQTICVLTFPQVLTISEENAPVALWDLVSRNGVVLLPPCNADQQLKLAQLLIKTVREGSQTSRHATAGYVSFTRFVEQGCFCPLGFRFICFSFSIDSYIIVAHLSGICLRTKQNIHKR